MGKRAVYAVFLLFFITVVFSQITTNTSGIVLSTAPPTVTIEKQDYIEKYLNFSIDPINSTAIRITFSLNDTLRQEIIECYTNLTTSQTCDVMALKAKWLAEYVVTENEFKNDLLNIKKVITKNLTDGVKISTVDVDYTQASFSIIVQFSQAGQRFQIGNKSLILSTDNSGNHDTKFIVRNSTGALIVGYNTGFDNNMTIFNSTDNGQSFPGTNITVQMLAGRLYGSISNDVVHYVYPNKTSSTRITYKNYNTTTGANSQSFDIANIGGVNMRMSEIVPKRNGSLSVAVAGQGVAIDGLMYESSNGGRNWALVSDYSNVITDAFHTWMTETSNGTMHVLSRSLSTPSNITYLKVDERRIVSGSRTFDRDTGSTHEWCDITSGLDDDVYAVCDKKVSGTAVLLFDRLNNATGLWGGTTIIANYTDGNTSVPMIRVDVATNNLWIFFFSDAPAAAGGSQCQAINSTDKGASWSARVSASITNCVHPYPRGLYPWIAGDALDSSRRVTIDTVVRNGTELRYTNFFNMSILLISTNYTIKAEFNETTVTAGNPVRANLTINVSRGLPDRVNATFRYPGGTFLNVSFLPIFTINQSADRESGNISLNSTAGASGVTFYNFTDSTNNKAWTLLESTKLNEQPLLWDNGHTAGTAVNAACYTALSVSDDSRCSTTGAIKDSEASFRFNFTINEAVATITELNLTMEMQSISGGGAEDCAFVVANHTSQTWNRFHDNDVGIATDLMANKTLTGNAITEVIGGVSGNKLALGAHGTKLDEGESCDVDFVQVSVKFSSDSVNVNSTDKTYGAVASDASYNISMINVTVRVAANTSAASYATGNEIPDLVLLLWNGTDWRDKGTFGFNASGAMPGTLNLSIALGTGFNDVLNAWKNVSLRNITIRARNMDSNGALLDQINFSDVNITLQYASAAHWTNVWTDTSATGVYNITEVWANKTTGDVNITYFNNVSFTVPSDGQTFKRIVSEDFNFIDNQPRSLSGFRLSSDGTILREVNVKGYDGQRGISIIFFLDDNALRFTNRERTADSRFILIDDEIRQYTGTRLPSDTVIFADSLSKQLSATRLASDALTFIESVFQISSFERITSDSFRFVDESVKRATAVRDISDLFIFVDQADRQLTASRQANDFIVILDTSGRTISVTRISSDDYRLSDASTRALSYLRTADDIFLLRDASGRSAVFVKLASDSYVLIDQSGRTLTATRKGDDVFLFVDESGRQLTAERVFSDIMVLRDEAGRALVWFRQADDAILFLDAAGKRSSLTRLLSDRILTPDSAFRRGDFSRTVSDIILILSSIFVQYTPAGGQEFERSAVDAFLATDALYKQSTILRSLSDLYLISDASFREFSGTRSSSDRVILVDVNNRLFTGERGASELFRLLDSTGKTLTAGRLPDDIISFVDQSGRGFIIQRITSDIIILTDSTGRQITAIRLADNTIVFVDELGRRITIIRHPDDTYTFLDSEGRTIMSTRVVADTAILSDSSSKAREAFRQVSDSFIIREIVSRVGTFERLPQDISRFIEAVSAVGGQIAQVPGAAVGAGGGLAQGVIEQIRDIPPTVSTILPLCPPQLSVMQCAGIYYFAIGLGIYIVFFRISTERERPQRTATRKAS